MSLATVATGAAGFVSGVVAGTAANFGGSFLATMITKDMKEDFFERDAAVGASLAASLLTYALDDGVFSTSMKIGVLVSTSFINGSVSYKGEREIKKYVAGYVSGFTVGLAGRALGFPALGTFLAGITAYNVPEEIKTD